MQQEAPFITKALKLVSLALIVATVTIAGTAAYSGYEEYGALTSSVLSGPSSGATISLNGSNLQISGLDVPNKMTFPLTLELLGGLSINNVSFGIFDSGAFVIQPNESQKINITIPISFEQILNDPQVLRQAAFNSSILGITTTISAHMVPLLGINVTRSANTTSGPFLGDLSASVNTSGVSVVSGSGNVEVPVVLSWENSSPLTQGSFWLQANLTEIPNRPSGNYGHSSDQMDLVSGYNRQTLEFSLPASDFKGSNPATGIYTVSIAIGQSNSSLPFLQFARTVSE